MQGQEDVEVDQEPLASSALLEGNGYTAFYALLERNEQAAYTLSYIDASSHQLPVPGHQIICRETPACALRLPLAEG